MRLFWSSKLLIFLWSYEFLRFSIIQVYDILMIIWIFEIFYHPSLWYSSDHLGFRSLLIIWVLRIFWSSEFLRVFYHLSFWDYSDHLSFGDYSDHVSFGNLLIIWVFFKNLLIIWVFENLLIIWVFEKLSSSLVKVPPRAHLLNLVTSTATEKQD